MAKNYSHKVTINWIGSVSQHFVLTDELTVANASQERNLSISPAGGNKFSSGDCSSTEINTVLITALWADNQQAGWLSTSLKVLKVNSNAE